MEMVVNKRRATHEIARIQLSKAYLHRTLTHEDCEDGSTYCLVNVYLAVLHYTTGKCQKAIDHCTLVTRSQDHSQCSLHVVQGIFLPKIDDNVDNVLGLVVFYQYIRKVALNQRQHEGHVGVFTTEMFAHYFSTKHLFVANCRLMPKAQDEQSVHAAKLNLFEELKLFCNTIVSTPHLLVTDLMLCKLPNNRTVSAAYDSISGDCGRQQLVSLMTEFSVEQLLKYRHLTPPQDTSSTAVSDITYFKALYLYRCRLYEKCELLCQQTIHDLIDADINKIPLVSTTYHEFVQLMDNDVVSIIGLMVLLDKSRAQSLSREPITITHLTLSLYLLTKCQIIWRPKLKFEDILSTLAIILDWITVPQKIIPVDVLADHVILKLAERQAVLFVLSLMSEQNGSNAHSDK